MTTLTNDLIKKISEDIAARKYASLLEPLPGKEQLTPPLVYLSKLNPFTFLSTANIGKTLSNLEQDARFASSFYALMAVFYAENIGDMSTYSLLVHQLAFAVSHDTDGFANFGHAPRAGANDEGLTFWPTMLGDSQPDSSAAIQILMANKHLTFALLVNIALYRATSGA